MFALYADKTVWEWQDHPDNIKSGKWGLVHALAMDDRGKRARDFLARHAPREGE